MNNARQLLLPVFATVFFPVFLRLMGAKVGKGAEISTLMHVSPDLLEVGEESFLADACIVGAHKIHAGCIEILPTKLGRRSFVGNSALVQGGADIGEDSLVGVMTVPPISVPAKSRWLGAPSFELTTCCSRVVGDDTKTYAPSRWLVLARTLVDAGKIVLPSYISAVEFVLFICGISLLDAVAPVWALAVATPLMALLLASSNVLAAACVKKVLVGTYQPTTKPLWSSFVWFNEVVNGVFEAVAAPVLTPFMGTPFIAMFMRIMGCKIGREVFLETTLFSEFDLVEIGDGAALNFGSTIQTHLFEDRVMKMDHLKIGEGCTVGNMSVVLYATHMQQGATLAPLSLLMKGETLPSMSRWAGIPTQPEGIELARRTVHETRVYDFSDIEWSIIVPLLPSMPSNGRRGDDRRVVSGIFYVLRTGAAWRNLPSRYGPSSTVYGRYRNWARKGVWVRVFEELAACSPQTLQMEEDRLSRIYRHAARSESGSRTARRSKSSTDLQQGRPLRGARGRVGSRSSCKTIEAVAKSNVG